MVDPLNPLSGLLSDLSECQIETQYQTYYVTYIPFFLFSRVNATLEAAMLVGRSVGPSCNIFEI